MSPKESACARCSKALGSSCCEVLPGEQLASLTLADVERISRHARVKAEAFSEDEWLPEHEAIAYEARRPLYMGYFRHGPRRITLKTREGACVFLDRKTGCVLPGDVRPTACQLYPFELFPSGKWSLQVDRHGSVAEARSSGALACLAVEESKRMAEILRAFGLTRADVERLGEQISAEVKDHARRTSPRR
jgi:uncharacterized protein